MGYDFKKDLDERLAARVRSLADEHGVTPEQLLRAAAEALRFNGGCVQPIASAPKTPPPPKPIR